MKMIIAALMIAFTLSGCLIFETRQGPPPWAPAHGYRRKHTKIIIVTPAQHHDHHHGKGKGHHK